MRQLKMYWTKDSADVKFELPEGYSFSKYKTEADKKAWFDCCVNGQLVDENADPVESFNGAILSRPEINLTEDVFFLDYNGEHIGTFTAYKRASDGFGDLHMVALREDFRGKKLGNFLPFKSIEHFRELGVDFAELTTDDPRLGAIKGYLAAGFKPVEYDMGMQDRWEKTLEKIGVESAEMLYEDTTPFITIKKKSIAPKIKFGVLGAGRGRSMMNYCKLCDNAELVAVCDCNERFLRNCEDDYGDGKIKFFSDFDEFLKEDMDCVALANYANEHAPFAIKCMKAGKNVLSEVLPVQTMKEAVELIETVEETGKVYAYAENYCYMPAPRTMKRLFREGKIGTFEYGEGEYMHNCEPIWHSITRGDPDHWRNNMSAFYYCTHSLGPLLHISGMRPVKVVGFEAPFNTRMARMGAKAGPFGIEMITLENGAILKSAHGVGPSKSSIWYSIYGSKGRLESAREDANVGGTEMLYSLCDEEEGGNNREVEIISTEDGLTEIGREAGHGGSDFYVMFNLVQKLRGNKNADIVDVYEALDMFLPGMFAYRSVRQGGIPVDVPNLRNKEERDFWRNDTECTDPKLAGDMLIPSYSKGNPDIPDEIYENIKKHIEEEYKQQDEARAKKAAEKEAEEKAKSASSTNGEDYDINKGF